MTATRLALVLVAALAVSPLTAQTYAERLERAIFTEETLGDLNGALEMYADLGRAQAVPSEVAAVAKARLAAATRRRTQAAPAGPHGPAAPAPSAQAGGDPQADRARRIEELFKQVAANLEALRRGECCGLFSGNYDPSRTVTVSGTVVAVQWLNPQSIVFVNGTDGNTWGFTMASPNTMIRAGMNKNSLRPGDQVLVNGYPAKGTAEACPGPLPNSCEKFDQGALHASATTIVGDDGRVIFDRLQGEQLEQRRLEEQQRQLEQDLGRSGR